MAEEVEQHEVSLQLREPVLRGWLGKRSVYHVTFPQLGCTYEVKTSGRPPVVAGRGASLTIDSLKLKKYRQVQQAGVAAAAAAAAPASAAGVAATSAAAAPQAKGAAPAAAAAPTAAAARARSQARPLVAATPAANSAPAKHRRGTIPTNLVVFTAASVLAAALAQGRK